MRSSICSRVSLFCACLASSLAPFSSCASPPLVQDDYTYTTNEAGEATITGFNASYSGNLSIKSTLGGCRVTRIMPEAFLNCLGLTSVTIPTSVIDLGEYTFRGCTGLTNAVIGNGVTWFDWSHFLGCTNLTHVDIGNGVTHLPEEASWEVDFPNLTSLALGSQIKDVGILSSFSSLTSLSVSVLNTTYSSLNGVLFDKNRQSLVMYPPAKAGIYTIPGSVTRIGDDAFIGCSGLTGITIPGSVTYIGQEAFYGCTGLGSATFHPSSDTEIQQGAFACCTSLTNVVLVSGVTRIGQEAFRYCPALTLITLPASVYYLGGEAFCDCPGLTDVVFEGNPPAYGHNPNPFYASDNVTVYYQQSATGWGSTFADRPAVMQARFAYAVNSDNTATLTGYSGAGGSIALPSYIENHPVAGIGFGAFFGTTNLTEVTIPDGVTRIGDGAFWKCSGLTTVTVPASVTDVGWRAFSECGSLSSVFFLGNAPSEGSDVFYLADSVTVYHLQDSPDWETAFVGTPVAQPPFTYSANRDMSVSIDHYFGSGGAVIIPPTLEGKPVSAIRERAFADWPGLTSVTIPASVTRIEHDAFSYCPDLTSITIPDGVIYIEDRVFAGCCGLTSINLPGSVFSIGDEAFYKCDRLTSVMIPDGVTFIGDRAFYGCASLTEITLPNSLAQIGYGVFGGRSTLRSVTLLNDLSAFSAGWVFGGGTSINLTSVIIGDSVTHIGDEAFTQCDGLSSVTIGSRVSDIGSFAFASCFGLTSVTIPDSVTSIGYGAFYDCKSLTNALFSGDAPYSDGDVFESSPALITYFPGTTGWGATFGGRPALCWNPQILRDARFGVQAGTFGFNIAWASGRTIAVEACTNLSSGVWTPLLTAALGNSGSVSFSDPASASHPARFYRLATP